MKKNLQKTSLSGLMVIILSIFPLLNLFGQDVPGNVVTGGTMEEEDEQYWNVYVNQMDDLGDTPEYEFGSDLGCTACEGNGLEVWAAGSGYTNIVFWQKVTMKANHVYRANAAYKSLDDKAQNNWCLLRVKIDTFPMHENDPASGLDPHKLLGVSAYSGCGQTEDATLQEIACDGVQMGENGYGYLAPDTLGDEFTAFFAIVAGMWTNQATGAYPYDFIIDEVVLIDSNEAASSSVEPNKINNRVTLMNFPNPFTQHTTIIYDIPARSDVKLTVYNLLGQEIANLYEGIREAGTHRAELNVSGFADNVLICKLEYNNQVVIRKMTVMKW